ncbi:MAG: beta-ketoacyl-[acyl-carrier-protein] synthase family protein [Spirochaetales bacterium]|nr:beta-ketoacyl-[acyl-carrier-protein] synthase family protein [Spirochaetales bacterium]
MSKNASSGKPRRIVITGIGTINPVGNTVREFWDNLKQGKSGVRLLQNLDVGDYYIKIGGEVDFPENIRDYFIAKKMIKRLDRYILHVHIAGIQALRDSGLDMEKEGHNAGAIFGTGAGGTDAHIENVTRYVLDSMNAVSPFYIISTIPSTGTAFFCQEAGVLGPSYSVNSACATGNHAFGLACMHIMSGQVDIMFAGGSEASVNKSGISSFGNIQALSARNDSPETASRPFDRDRDGFVISEGAGVLCLEELEHARKRGARIYAELSGFGFTSDAHDLVAPHPEANGAVRAINLALKSAGLNHEDIDLINCHGTSTPLGDKIESIAINNAFGSLGPKVPVHSTKSMTGHLLGGTSAVEAVAEMMTFTENCIHQTTNQFNQDPEINLNVITENRDAKKVNHILSNAFGFGGMNAVIIMSRFRD